MSSINFRILTSHYRAAAQDLAYTAHRLGTRLNESEVLRLKTWLDMVVETHRRRCELLGVDTGRVPPKTQPFPLTDQQVHEAWLTDPKVYMLGSIFRRVREACVEVGDEHLAALAVYVLAHAGQLPGFGPMIAAAVSQAPREEDIKKLLEQLELL